MSFFRCSGKTLSDEEFQQMKDEIALSQGLGMKKINKDENIAETRENNTLKNSTICEDSLDNDNQPLKRFIHDRYRSIVDNNVNTLLFIMIKSDRGNEVECRLFLKKFIYLFILM